MFPSTHRMHKWARHRRAGSKSSPRSRLTIHVDAVSPSGPEVTRHPDGMPPSRTLVSSAECSQVAGASGWPTDQPPLSCDDSRALDALCPETTFSAVAGIQMELV